MGADNSSLWSFSLRVYGAPGVADACLELQDGRGLDVNVLLFCVWAGLARGEVDETLMSDAEEFSSDWSSRVVRRLRGARRALASNAESALAQTERSSEVSTACAALRAEIQRVELAAEKLEQEHLERLAQRLPALDLAPAAARESARRNLERYLAAAGVSSDSWVESRLAGLIDAALDRA